MLTELSSISSESDGLPINEFYKTWNRLTDYLEDDERLVYPKMYLENRKMYDKICGVVYLIKSRSNMTDGIDWVWENKLHEIINDPDIMILAKQLVVRIRLPWNEVNFEWTIGQEELNARHQDYEVIDVFLRVQDKLTRKEIVMIDPLEMDINPDKYEILEIRYLVAWKLSPESENRILGIDPDSIHTMIQQ